MTAFTHRDLHTLRRLAGRMIPPDATYGVPGADDKPIFAEIVRALEPGATTLSPWLAGIAAGGLAARDDAGVDEILQSRLAANDPVLLQAVAAVMQCYYRDDRVLASLGMEPRAPFPKGFEVEEGDWSLLDPVRARRKLWRDAL